MIAFLLNLVMIALVMWAFFRFMYPKPPKAFFPQEGDDTTLRTCHYCGHQLATFRGILIEHDSGEHFFCNETHQTAFYETQTYAPTTKTLSSPKKLD